MSSVDSILDASTRNVKRSYFWGRDVSGSLRGAGGIGGLLAETVAGSNGGTYLADYDAHGDVVGLVDSQGNAAATYEYGPFGEVVRSSGPANGINPFGFSTKYTDAETGLDYYGYRYYNPSTGRWASRDPSGEGSDINLYAISENDLLDYVDSLGLFTYACCNKAKRDAGANSLKKQYSKYVDGSGQYTSGSADVQGPPSCYNINGAILNALQPPICWECHLEHRDYDASKASNGWKRAVTRTGLMTAETDHWAIICTSVNEYGKKAESLIFDATGGCTGDETKFDKFWERHLGTMPDIPPSPVPCPRS